jgi:hypothetical protein
MSIRFHWQNLNEKKNDKLGSGMIHGRAWLNLWGWKFHWEWHLWSRSCGLSVDVREEGWGDDDLLFGAALPPVALYFGIQAPWKSRLKRLLPKDPRSCALKVHNWTIWFDPWTNPMCWESKSPWWRKGVSLNLPDLFLGRHAYSVKEMRPQQRVEIELDGRRYHGTAKFEESRWKRPRWFELVRQGTWISMDQGEGLPHAGKGTCSWNCGDDALCGWGVEGYSVPKAIGHGIETVLECRDRYGMPQEGVPEKEAA